MIRTFRTRTSTIQAVQFDGRNMDELELAVKEVCDREAFFADLMEVGCWVLLTPPQGDRIGSYQVLPNSVMRRCYEPVDGSAPQVTMPVQVIPIPIAKTCFSCIHHLGNRCELYDEEIESEIYAAMDCSAYDPGVQ